MQKRWVSSTITKFPANTEVGEALRRVLRKEAW